MNKKTKRLTLSAILLSLMLILGYLESLLPSLTTVPGIKLGLSNSVLLFAVYMLDIPTAFCLMVMKVLLSGMLFGGFTAAMYAFAGGLLSMIAMSLLSRIKGINPIAVSMTGGAFHNIGQVALAMFILHSQQLIFYMAILILAGLVCGALTGICAVQTMKLLKKSKYFRDKK